MKVDPEIIALAIGAHNELNSNLATLKDKEALGSRTDVRKFLPQRQQGTGQPSHLRPLHYGHGQQPAINQPVNNFSPIKLPSMPEALLPLPPNAKDYINRTEEDIDRPAADPSFSAPKLPPSFKSTEFLKPTPVKKQTEHRDVDTALLLDAIESLTKMVKTLNRNVNKLMKLNERNSS